MTHCKRAAALLLAAVLVLALAACGKQAAAPETTAAPAVETPAVSTPAPTAAPTPAATPSAAGNDGWKAEFEKSLLENYGVTPDHYEDIGNGVYQVYVKVNGKVVPYVTVDSATGDYHG